MNKKFTLGKKEKLKSRKIITNLFIQNKNIKLYPIKLVWQVANNENDSCVLVGFSIPKKKIKHAVDRNKIKRQLREAYRLNKQLLTQNNNTKVYIMFVYISSKKVSYKELEYTIKYLLTRLSDEIYTMP